MFKKLSLVSMSILLSACSVGPDYHRPILEMPSHWQNAPTLNPALAQWWMQFEDEKLLSLIQQSLDNNQDLKRAIANVDAASAALGLAHADYFPTANAALNATRSKAQMNVSSPASQPSRTQYDLGLVINYEIDLWGRVRHANEAAAAQLASDIAVRDGVRATVAAHVARAYFQARAFDRRIALLERLHRTQKENVSLQQKRMEAGSIAPYDYEQARSEAYAVEAQLPALRAARSHTLTALAVLRGISPQAMTQAWQKGFSDYAYAAPPNLSSPLTASLPNAPVVPMDLPSELIERRPDIRAAEQQLVAANARIGVAKAAYFPQLSLTGFAGSVSHAFSSLLERSSENWQLWASLSQPVSDIHRVGMQVDTAQAQHSAAQAAYIKTVQVAFQETLDALTNVHSAREIMHSQNSRVDALTSAYQMANARYQAGDISYLELLDIERQLRQIEQEQVTAQLSLLQSTVDLYRALGGGWQIGNA